jgi:hypothetical protein
MDSHMFAMALHTAVAAVQVEEAILGLPASPADFRRMEFRISMASALQESSIPWAPIMNPTGSVVFACTCS